MTLRTGATAEIVSRLTPSWGSKIAVGRMRSTESDGQYAVVIPGEEEAESDAPLGPVQIRFSVFVFKVKSGDDHAMIDSLISGTRTAIETGEPETFEIVYIGAAPIYSEDGGPLIGAELRYTAKNFIG